MASTQHLCARFCVPTTAVELHSKWRRRRGWPPRGGGHKGSDIVVYNCHTGPPQRAPCVGLLEIMASLDKCLALLVVLSMISMVTGYVEPEDRFPEGLNLYCQRKNCYEVCRPPVLRSHSHGNPDRGALSAAGSFPVAPGQNVSRHRTGLIAYRAIFLGANSVPTSVRVVLRCSVWTMRRLPRR
jgi:hypothetical protein